MCVRCYTRYWRKENPEKYKKIIKDYNKLNAVKIKKASQAWHKKYLSRRTRFICIDNCTVCGQHGRLTLTYSVKKGTEIAYSSGYIYFAHRKIKNGKTVYSHLCSEGSITNKELLDFLKFKKETDKKYEN